LHTLDEYYNTYIDLCTEHTSARIILFCILFYIVVPRYQEKTHGFLKILYLVSENKIPQKLMKSLGLIPKYIILKQYGYTNILLIL